MISIPFFNLYAQYQALQQDIDSRIGGVISTSSFINGSEVSIFESHFASLHNSSHCVACGNGTDALFIALKGLGVSPGDEVITTALSWISTSEAISQCGAKPVFCDIDKQTYNLDLSQIETLITEHTVGILPVHLYGNPVDLESVQVICNKYHLWLLEDCAQAHLASYNNKYVGTISDAATFSFFPTKNLGAMGDAGCILTNNTKIAEFSRLFANHGGKNIHSFEGINSRLDSLQACVLNAKLSYIKTWTENRIRLANVYSEQLASKGDLIVPNCSENSTHVFHLYTLRSRFRDKLKVYLAARGIPTLTNYSIPLPLLPCYEKYNYSACDFPVSSEVASTLLQLPLCPFLSTEHQSHIVSSVCTFFD